ncbi:MAG: tyrosine-type recombinase/integrase [Peptococcaceae bacterium]|nr:tyrosine-type recombinase/integrase [Peptococcaceae bacterium]
MAKVAYLTKSSSENLPANFAAAFAAHLRDTDRGNSAHIYAGEVKRFGEWTAERYGQFHPWFVTPLDLVEYRRWLQEGKRKASTVNRILTSLRVFFAWLESTGQIQGNPAKGIKSVAVNEKLAPKWLSRRDQAAFVHAVRGSRDQAMVALMLHAGLRVNEVCHLAREDIQIFERKGSVEVRQGKGNKARTVPLNKTARKILSDWLDRNPDGPLFPNKFGRPIGTRGVRKMVEESAYRAKLTEVTPHTLRHVFCKNLVDMGVPLDQVAMLAGHSSLDVTKRYTAPSMADLQAAVDRASWE